MKNKTLVKKLNLSKETVSRLNHIEEKKIKGGLESGWGAGSCNWFDLACYAETPQNTKTGPCC